MLLKRSSLKRSENASGKGFRETSYSGDFANIPHMLLPSERTLLRPPANRPSRIGRCSSRNASRIRTLQRTLDSSMTDDVDEFRVGLGPIGWAIMH
jgi:hypothetical protein